MPIPPMHPPDEAVQVVLGSLIVLDQIFAPRGLTKGYSLLHLNRGFMLTWNLQDHHDDRLRFFGLVF